MLLLAIAVLLVVLIALVAVLLIRQPQQPAKQSPTTERTRTPEKTPAHESTQSNTSKQAQENTVQTNFSGRGSDTITIDFKGPVVVTTTYSYTDEGANPGYFSITLLDGQGRELDLIANHVGSTQGSKASRIPSAGRYYFNVDAPNGSWTIQFT